MTAGCVALGWGVRWVLNPFLGGQIPFLFFFPAIVGASWFVGRSAGFLAVVLSAAAGVTFADPERAPVPLMVGLFLVVGSALAVAVDSMRSARDEAREYGDDVRRLASIVESSEDAIIVKDLKGRIVEWNRSAERLFGYRRGEAVGRSIEILMPPDRPDDWRKILARVAAGERVEHFETRRRARDGRILDVSLTVSPVREREGRIVGAAKIVRDVTAEREGLRETERTRELFLGMLGHDLRNPLNAIAVSVHVLKRRARDADQEALARISRSADRMARMIDQLLSVTKSRLGGGIPIQAQDADLAAICRATVDELELLHPGRIRLSAEGDLSGRWDVDRLHELLGNLVGNALLHGSPDEPVTVSARSDGASVVVEVTNRGPDIPASLLPMLFDPFRRGPSREPRVGKGLGLGLYIVREIVKAHGGEVTVRSAGGATTFEVTLPRSTPAVASAAS